MTSPNATSPAPLDPAPDSAKKISADSTSTHYDTRLPDLPWSRRIQIPIIAAAVYSVIRILGPTLRYEVLGWQNAERVHAAGKRCICAGARGRLRVRGQDTCPPGAPADHAAEREVCRA